MPDRPPRRFLIVGSGIAGSLLAWELLRLGGEVTVCRDPACPGSSRVAAGLLTPITGIRFVKSWNFDLVFPQARETYSELASLSGRKIFAPFPILRLFKNQEESLRWQRKADQADLRGFILQKWSQLPPLPGLRHEGGGLEINGGGWVDMAALIAALQEISTLRGASWLEEAMDYGDVKLTAGGGSWRGRDFDRILFCQGYRPENPWFDWLSWKPAQGEILTLRIPGFPSGRIINRGIFLLPLGHDLFRCGSTYNWRHLKAGPAPGGREQLEAEIRALITLPYEVVDHRSAIRPILKDSVPVLGSHPQHKALGIFNGLGSKAALTAPFYARHFARQLLRGEPLAEEVDVARNS